MLQWFVAKVKTSLAFDVIIGQLKEQNFESYCPLVVRRTFLYGALILVQKPLFPSYLFVNLDLDAMQWRSVNYTTGIHYLLPLRAERPKPVPTEFIEALQRDRTVLKKIETVRRFAEDEIVRVLSGALAGQTGEVLSSEPKWTRIKLAARDLIATVPTHDLGPAPGAPAAP